MFPSMIIPHLRRHAMVVGFMLAIFGITLISIGLHYDSVQIRLTNGELKLSIEAKRR